LLNESFIHFIAINILKLAFFNENIKLKVDQ